MLTSTYEEALDKVKQLTPDEQLQLLEELVAIVRQRVRTRPKHSITELRGLGKEIWQKIDVEKYIEEDAIHGMGRLASTRPITKGENKCQPILTMKY